MKSLIPLAVGLLLLALPATANVAVPLSSLSNPTVLTLLSLGSSGVMVGNDRFYSFRLFSSNSNSGHPSSGEIAVEPVVAPGTDGLSFTANWTTTNSNAIETLSYKMSSDLGVPVTQISLLSDGATPPAAWGSFTLATLSASLPGGGSAMAPLSTPGAGIQTDSSSLVPESDLVISEAITVHSISGGTGGSAPNAVIENTFSSLPEPDSSSLLCIPLGAAIAVFLRRPQLDRNSSFQTRK